jgi:aldehyde:ferredoxin oxidoreductase
MSKDLYGWCGKILKVDLNSGEIDHLETQIYAERFLGGRGIASRIYWDEVGPTVGAFDPENHLIFMTGPLGATGAQAASRMVVAGKSPMLKPEGFCYGNLGGFFGPYLKKAGYDGLVILGRSSTPSYLWIHDDNVSIMDASDIWRLGAYAVGDHLKKKHGGQVRFITTGVAGENLCRSATLITDNEGSATGGWGAVMGSKNLKAIAVLGSGAPKVADPEGLTKLNKLVVRLNKRAPWSPFPEDQVRRISRASCYQCGLDCILRNTYQTASGEKMVRKCQSMFVYYPWVLRRVDESAETAVKATGICNDLSLCTMEVANIIQWLENCCRTGVLTSNDTGLDMEQIGSLAFFEHLAGMVATREGIGDLLAEGLVRAGEKLGDEAIAQFPNEVSDVGDGATYSAREYLMNGILYAFEPRQPIAMLHEISRIIGQWVQHLKYPSSSPVTADVYRSAAKKFWRHDKAWDLNTIDGKAAAAVRIMDRTYVKDSLCLCDSNWPLMVSWNTPDNVGDPTLESKVYSAVTGLKSDEESLLRYGEKIFNLQRAILLREGRRPKQDDVLDEFNFQDPVQSVFMNPDVIVPGPGDEVLSRRDCTLGRDEFQQMRKEFYELRGWDQDTGLQKSAMLRDLGLDDITDDLSRLGLVKGN